MVIVINGDRVISTILPEIQEAQSQVVVITGLTSYSI